MQLPKRACVHRGTGPKWGIRRAWRACRCKSAPIHVKARSTSPQRYCHFVGSPSDATRGDARQVPPACTAARRWQRVEAPPLLVLRRPVIADWQSRRRFRQF
ncbi:hypothetical protein L1887_43974 [Cichorium endivia]|nr:hypothetical protein L1887_43974 [Cichorium endivia]